MLIGTYIIMYIYTVYLSRVLPSEGSPNYIQLYIICRETAVWSKCLLMQP